MPAKIKAKKREDLTRSNTKELREQGQVPAVVYGKKKEPATVSVDSMELIKTVRQEGKNAVFLLEIDGGNTMQVMLHDYQADPIKDELIHADFYLVDMSATVDVEVAIHLDGEATGAKNGGVLQQTLRELNVRAKPDDIPEEIRIDVSKLEIGDSVTVGDLKQESGYEILDDDDRTIVTVLPPQNQEKADDEGEDPQEPEAIHGGEE
ncbi:MAG: 50S ribosomal protein L25/general stress protein Ctc [Bacillaceae bacterium]|nr:50S ribosomal protein L25/general stress protein Ctc [Bacillaceae bacterium]